MSLERSAVGTGQHQRRDQQTPSASDWTGYPEFISVPPTNPDLALFGIIELPPDIYSGYGPFLGLTQEELVGYTDNTSISTFYHDVTQTSSSNSLSVSPIQLTSQGQLMTLDSPPSNSPTQPKENKTRTQLTLRDKIEWYFLDQLLFNIRNGKQIVSEIYNAKRTTGYDINEIGHILAKLPDQYLDKNRITKEMREVLNQSSDVPTITGRIKLENTISSITLTTGFKFSDEEFKTIPQHLLSYLELSRSEKPQGCIFQNFSMHWLMKNMRGADNHVWFYEIIEVTAFINDQGVEEGYAAHVIACNGTGSMYFSQIVKANENIIKWMESKNIPREALKKTHHDGNYYNALDQSLRLIGTLGLAGSRSGINTLACMNEYEIRCLFSGLSEGNSNSNDNFKIKVMEIPDRFNSILPLGEFTRKIKSEYSRELGMSSNYTKQYVSLRTLLNESLLNDRLNTYQQSITARFSELKRALRVWDIEQ